MTEVITFPGVSPRPFKAQPESARTRFPPRQVRTDWADTRQDRGEVWERLTSGIFVLSNPNSQERRSRGLAWLLDWLSDQPGETWQHAELSGALVVAICGDLLRPSLSCLVAGAASKGCLTCNLARTRDPQGFARLRALCDADPHVSLRRKPHAAAQRGNHRREGRHSGRHHRR